MAQKNETDPFLPKDLYSALETLAIEDRPTSDSLILHEYWFDKTVEIMMIHITDFINENYLPKP